MLEAFLNIWRIKELRNKLLFTLGMLAIYRVGFYIPLPGVDQKVLAEWAQQNQSGSALGNVITYMSIFTGGGLGQSTIFSLGVMPYISASIIFQLLTTVVPALKQLQDEGPAGRQKIQEYSRYVTVLLCVIQSVFWLQFLMGRQYVYPDYQSSMTFWLCGILGLTGGTLFLMWLGEQIDKYGIGNGMSLIITAGIVAGMGNAVMLVAGDFSVSPSDTKTFHVDTVVFLVLAFVAVVAGSIVITQGQRRIPVQQAKHTRGRRVYGGQRSFLPLRVNHGGVMPIIFASSLMIFPSMVIGYLKTDWGNTWWWQLLDRSFLMHGIPYVLMYVGMIYFFAYFWTTVQFQPKEMAKQLRDGGSFIPGMRPGPRTAEYLETVMERITYVGAGFLCVIAIIPTVVAGVFHIPFTVSSFLGGTGLLIVVSVMLDLIQRIEAALLMRNYQGFLSGDRSGRGGRRIRGARAGA